MKPNAIFCLCIALAAAGLWGKDKGPARSSSPRSIANSKAVKIINTTWDMTVRVRGTPVLMVIRQEGNMYPSFWLGRAIAGKFVLSAREDALTDEIVVESKGCFTLKTTTIPRKQGMEDQIPGGVWTTAGRDMNVAIEFKQFKEWRVVEAKSDAVKLTAAYEGTFIANGKSAAISGPVSFALRGGVGVFDLDLLLSLPGAQLGLEGDQAPPLQIKVHMYSAASTDVPPAHQGPDRIDVDDR